MAFNQIIDNIDLLLTILPEVVKSAITQYPDHTNLYEIVLDVGRYPEARFKGNQIVRLSENKIRYEDIDYVVSRIGFFTADNRAGIEGTLHRISAIRNRQGKIIGLTLRIGRAIQGTIEVIRDIVNLGKSILVVGPPGMGKTTKLREISRVMSDELKKRVIIVDTSNEIGGDGDIPHPGIGGARRMQVSHPNRQHAVMIEAVENHMPEVIVIDEIGTEEEAAASRTIAERGVTLVATAHGNTIENLMKNPTLSDLVGGIQSVTLSDEEARRRGTQKAILERKGPPTFSIIVEMRDMHTLAIYKEVSDTIDKLLLGKKVSPEIRVFDEEGKVTVTQQEIEVSFEEEYRHYETDKPKDEKVTAIFPYAVNRNRLERAIHSIDVPAIVVNNLDEANIVVTTKLQAKNDSRFVQKVADMNLSLHVIKSNTSSQITKFLRYIFKVYTDNEMKDEEALREINDVIENVIKTNKHKDAAPSSPYTRRLQHNFAAEKGFYTETIGDEPNRFVRVYPEHTE
ncbi:MAG: single-stranded DNA-binding protein [Candidatus Margulisiibacteriota bacterium]|nr:MAG: single-stranded DNA-binding protein [Candidatus Margulisbacteria bacterium GWD2_39_127]OGI05432.1 MAG: single-stranded DNA-binding protein [Candidatus Margulisbacteria bacterium GWF2_38_17]OGI07830.1 MAG: single-stranded DNA-binding protein [Candidatus Margulisbacteria bacterium GWE2_39_32]PZM80113.1 MAG: single-stranded DNA-binding protein [Candidatus Margulisiibacteriota bacterium]HAR62621.1 single-stranded DNA-binding protein [Candidatus Margulisiibacteriota bacterium]